MLIVSSAMFSSFFGPSTSTLVSFKAPEQQDVQVNGISIESPHTLSIVFSQERSSTLKVYYLCSKYSH